MLLLLWRAASGQEAAAGTVLVTGDSMSEPLDIYLSRLLTSTGVKTVLDPQIGTGISTSFVLDWRRYAEEQGERLSPKVVVMFIGANDGFALPDSRGIQIACCSAGWEAVYAARARQMMGAYLHGGAKLVLWLTLPLPRDPRRQRSPEP